MNVKELIEKLQTYDPNSLVLMGDGIFEDITDTKLEDVCYIRTKYGISKLSKFILHPLNKDTHVIRTIKAVTFVKMSDPIETT
jgi:hypothetical protein